MGGIGFGWLTVCVLSPDWLCHKLVLCDVLQARRWSRSAWERNVDHAPTLRRIPWHLPYNWRKPRKTPHSVTEWRSAVHATNAIRFVDLAIAGDGLDWPVVPGLPWLSRQATGSNLVQLKYLPCCRSRVFPTSFNLIKISRLGLLCESANSGTPRSSYMSVLLTYQRLQIARRRHLDCNTCNFRTWEREADLHEGHA